MRRTATIYRGALYGTPHYTLCVTSRGKILRWRGSHGGIPCDCLAHARDNGDDVFQAMKGHAKRMGFTHVRIAGDWSGRTKPKGGKV